MKMRGDLPKTEFIDPSNLEFREADQNRLGDVRAAFPEGDGYYPIVTISDRHGNRKILDGHNRATVAKERGDDIPAVDLTQEEYELLSEKGHDDMEIAYAALTRAEEYDAASSLNRQFPGARISERGEIAFVD